MDKSNINSRAIPHYLLAGDSISHSVDEEDRNKLVVLKHKFEMNEANIIHELYSQHFK